MWLAVGVVHNEGPAKVIGQDDFYLTSLPTPSAQSIDGLFQHCSPFLAATRACIRSWSDRSAISTRLTVYDVEGMQRSNKRVWLCQGSLPRLLDLQGIEICVTLATCLLQLIRHNRSEYSFIADRGQFCLTCSDHSMRFRVEACRCEHRRKAVLCRLASTQSTMADKDLMRTC